MRWLISFSRVFLVVLFSVALLAEDVVVINSSVDKQSLPINDTLALTLSLDGSNNLPPINLPTLADFDVLGNSTSTQIQITNGRQSMTKSYIFSLRPKRKGPAKIPTLQFQHEGKTFKTEQIAVNVTAYVTPNVQSNPVRRSPMDDFFNDDFFSGFSRRMVPIQRAIPAQQVIAEYVPRKSVLYRGEKTMIDFRLYFERGFQQGPVISFPDLNGLVSSGKPRQLKNPTPQTVKKDGKSFNVVSDTQWIYGASAGVKPIPALQIKYVDNPYEGVKTIATQAKSITIKELPSPEPDSFSGAVGSFTLAARLSSKAILKTGEAIPIVFTLNGMGNADMVNDLKLPELANATWYLDKMDSTGSDGLTVLKRFTYFITMSEAGNVVITPITFSYFDPAKGSYQALSVVMPPFEVTQGTGSAALAPSAITESAGINIKEGTVDIRLDKSLLHKLKLVVISGLKYLLLLLSFAVVTFMFWQWRSAPLRRIKKRLAQLKQQKLSNEDFIKEIYELMCDMVKVKYKFKLAGATNKQIKEKIKYVPTADALINIVSKHEEMSYAKSQITNADRREIINLIEKLG